MTAATAGARGAWRGGPLHILRFLIVASCLTACFSEKGCLPMRPSDLPDQPDEPDAGALSDVGPRPPDPVEEPTPPQLVAALTRSATAKITAAYEDGGIDLKTAALYQQYALFAPHLLPQP